MFMQMVFSLNCFSEGGGLRLLPVRPAVSRLGLTDAIDYFAWPGSHVLCLDGTSWQIDRDFPRLFDPL